MAGRQDLGPVRRVLIFCAWWVPLLGAIYLVLELAQHRLPDLG